MNTTTLTLGTSSYSSTDLQSILNKPAGIGVPDAPDVPEDPDRLTSAGGNGANGLVSLAHQLIAAKLNLLKGATAPAAVLQAILDADNLIGTLVVPPIGTGYLSPGSTAAITQILDDYNNGLTGPGHCQTTPAAPSTWGKLRNLYR